MGLDLAKRLASAVKSRNKAGKSSNGLGFSKPLRVLLVHGQQDTLVPLANSLRLMRLLPPGCGCEVAVLEPCGHMPHQEWTRMFNTLVSDFIQRAD